MSDDKKMGAPQSDETSALFVTARKKQLADQEAQRKAAEEEQKRLAAEAEVRRLEAEVAARKQQAEAEQRRLEQETEARRRQAEADARAAERAAKQHVPAQPQAATAKKPPMKAPNKKTLLLAGIGAAVVIVGIVLALVLGGGKKGATVEAGDPMEITDLLGAWQDEADSSRIFAFYDDMTLSVPWRNDYEVSFDIQDNVLIVMEPDEEPIKGALKNGKLTLGDTVLVKLPDEPEEDEVVYMSDANVLGDWSNGDGESGVITFYEDGTVGVPWSDEYLNYTVDGNNVTISADGEQVYAIVDGDTMDFDGVPLVRVAMPAEPDGTDADAGPDSATQPDMQQVIAEAELDTVLTFRDCSAQTKFPSSILRLNEQSEVAGSLVTNIDDYVEIVLALFPAKQQNQPPEYYYEMMQKFSKSQLEGYMDGEGVTIVSEEAREDGIPGLFMGAVGNINGELECGYANAFTYVNASGKTCVGVFLVISKEAHFDAYATLIDRMQAAITKS